MSQANYTPAFDNFLRSSFAWGEKVRRRASYVPEIFSFQLVLTRAQVQILSDFVSITLADVTPFEWVEHRDPAQGPAMYRFRARPAFESIGNRYWRASCSLDLLTPFNGAFLLSDDLGPLTTDDDESLTT